MVKKSSKKLIKKIQKQIDDSMDLLQKLEIRPCKGDADIKQKENEIADLKRHIQSLKKEYDRHQYSWWDKAQH